MYCLPVPMGNNVSKWVGLTSNMCLPFRFRFKQTAKVPSKNTRPTWQLHQASLSHDLLIGLGDQASQS